MRDDGFEALADGTLLLAVLLVASTVVIALAGPPPGDERGAGLRYAEDLRRALFGTTLDGLGYSVGGESVRMQDGTSVETFLRTQVHLRARGPADADFRTANDRIADVATRLVRPGWNASIAGGIANGTGLLRIPEGSPVPETYFASGWTYPSLDGSPEDVRLSVSVWATPRR